MLIKHWVLYFKSCPKFFVKRCHSTFFYTNAVCRKSHEPGSRKEMEFNLRGNFFRFFTLRLLFFGRI